MGAVRVVLDRERRVASLLPTLVARDIRSRYRHSVLDVAWALITPVLVLAVYGTILTESFSVEAACSPYLSSAWLGLVVWTFFATAVGNSVSSLVNADTLITKLYFPRETVPLATTGAALLDLLIGLASLGVVFVVQGVTLGANAVWSVLPLALVLVWSAFLSIVTAVLAVFARDVIHAVHLVLRVGFFATPVVYESSFLPPAFSWVTTYSPLAVALDALRTSLLCDGRPQVALVTIHLVIGVVLLIASILYVRSIESRLADVS